MNTLAIFPAITADKTWIHDQLAGLLALVAEHVPGVDLTLRDLAGLTPAEARKPRDPVGALVHGAPRCAVRERSDELVRELEAAELVVIGAPIGHHPTTPALAQWYSRSHASKGFGSPLHAMGLNLELQAWFSHVIRADRTFRYTASGPRGLLAGKKAIVLAAQTGPWHSAGLSAHQVHCIDTQLRFMGISEIATIASDRHANPVLNQRWQASLAQPLAA